LDEWLRLLRVTWGSSKAIRVKPDLCLDTLEEEREPGDSNLAFAVTTPGGAEVATVMIGEDTLEEGKNLFQHEGQVFFRPPAKPSGTLKGLLVTVDERAFDFEIRVATTVQERMTSLSTQLVNATSLASAAAARASEQGKESDAALALEDDLLDQALESQHSLLDSIEAACSSDRDFATFYARCRSLPVLGQDPELV
jgi:hypothetical protein